ncbi:PREDICTED: CD226 antigen, partial [Mesitornis unicolor]|uniref:CD226 antigen n=1 Tax=Mesitornis unicolor TaxID=54374 RepID=UPI0005284FFD
VSFEASEKQNNHVFTKPGTDVTFTCPYKIGDSVQQVKWERIKADQIDTIVLCSSSGKQSFGSDFKERTLVDCSDQANSMIIIQNFTASDFATYRCVATGRNETYVMSFTADATWDHKWFIIYIAGGVSAAVFLLVFLLIFCITTAYRKKKKRITETLRNAWYSTQIQPANSYGRSNFHGTWNIERRGEESSLGQTEEIYVNCRNASKKPRKDH